MGHAVAERPRSTQQTHSGWEVLCRVAGEAVPGVHGSCWSSPGARVWKEWAHTGDQSDRHVCVAGRDDLEWTGFKSELCSGWCGSWSTDITSPALVP
jgi:hypothetical protein